MSSNTLIAKDVMAGYGQKNILQSVNIHIPENKIMINHFIDYELLFYLYKINFAL